MSLDNSIVAQPTARTVDLDIYGLDRTKWKLQKTSPDGLESTYNYEDGAPTEFYPILVIKTTITAANLKLGVPSLRTSQARIIVPYVQTDSETGKVTKICDLQFFNGHVTPADESVEAADTMKWQQTALDVWYASYTSGAASGTKLNEVAWRRTNTLFT